MLNNEIERIVNASIDKHISSDTITKSELHDILIDVLIEFGKSKSLTDSVERNISGKLESKMRSKGVF